MPHKSGLLLKKVLDILQGSAATCFRCGGIVSRDFITNLLLSFKVKNFEN